MPHWGVSHSSALGMPGMSAGLSVLQQAGNMYGLAAWHLLLMR